MLANYKRCAANMQTQVVTPMASLLPRAASRIPYIKAYERLIQAIILNKKYSSILIPDAKILIGDIRPRLLALGILFLAVTSKLSHG